MALNERTPGQHLASAVVNIIASRKWLPGIVLLISFYLTVVDLSLGFQSREALFPSKAVFLWNWIPSLLYSQKSENSDKIALMFAEMLRSPPKGFKIKKTHAMASILSRLTTLEQRWSETNPITSMKSRESLLKIYTIMNTIFSISAPNASYFARAMALSSVPMKNVEGLFFLEREVGGVVGR